MVRREKHPQKSLFIPQNMVGAAANDDAAALASHCQNSVPLGIGSQLLAAAKRWARNRRLEYLELQVLAQNEGAQHLYESQDFVEATKVMRCML